MKLAAVQIEQWLQGFDLENVSFRPAERISGLSPLRRRKEGGTVLSLIRLEPQPCYIVRLDSGTEQEVWQSDMECMR